MITGFNPWQPSRHERLAITDRGQTILQEFIFAAGQVNNLACAFFEG